MRLLNSQRGVTLIESMVAISIAGLLAASGAPAMGDYIRNSRLREAGHSLLSEALYAQSEAVKRNGRVRLTVRGSAIEVVDRSGTSEVVLHTRTMPGDVHAGTTSLDFGSQGRPAPFGTEATVKLSLSQTTCSDTLRCPALRVEAGGAVRLCNDQSTCS
ncbi:MAG: GspH/FimT family pseudopilin [Burkholderiales bacterium]|jgi:type IV fimbrial biogenesis protein FimT|nr:GspH/FimT family pseudopilin [Burkholderiales bacterium]